MAFPESSLHFHTQTLVVVSHVAGVRPKGGCSTPQHRGCYLGLHSQSTHRKLRGPSDHFVVTIQ